ncbi:hypothetical protein V8E36_005310 [Tilletia maclaganii]
MAQEQPHVDELELEDVDIDLDDTDGGSDLADAYAAAYEAAGGIAVDEDDDEGNDDAETRGQGSNATAGPSKVAIYYDGKGQHKGVEISVPTVNAKAAGNEAAKKRRPTNILTPQDRRNRLSAHMLHVLCLIAWARYRNKLLNDDALQDYLADMVPAALMTRLHAIHPKKITEQRERVRLFEGFMTELISWWQNRFSVDEDLSARAGIRQPASATELLIPANARALPSGKVIDGWVVESPKEREERHRKEARRRAPQADSEAKGKQAKQISVKGKEKEIQPEIAPTQEIAIFPPGQESARSTTLPTYLHLLPAPEPIKSADDLLQAASHRFGSRETSAQLFCSLCRAIGVPSRLVVSLQVPPYSVGASKLASIVTEADKTMRRNPATNTSNSRSSKASAKRPVLGAVEPLNLTTPPTVWVEVFSKPFQRWLTVDPVRGELQATGNRYMEPAPHDKNNKLVYVVAVEEDNYCRDVTARYTRSLRSRVARLRPPAAMTGGKDWWDRVMASIHRPQRLDRDAMEDAEMDQSLQREPMPKSTANFKNHPVYVLEAQLKRNEAIFPRNRVGTFENQDVFLRQDVVEVHSARQWYVNYGRKLRRGPNGEDSTEEPLKWAKTRGYTIANKRAEEQAKAEGRGVPQEGLYAEFQTEVYTAPAIGENGVIPTNEFGNVDMYVPSMLPPGGAYIPFAGVGKVAKQLHIPYGDAVTGFEFRKGRSNPKVEGVVVAKFNAQTLLDAFWESERARVAKENEKIRERAIRNWRRACKAVLISLRIKRQYGPGSSAAADAAFRKAMGRDDEGKKSKQKGKGKEVRQLKKLDEDDEDGEELDETMSLDGSDADDGGDVAPGGFFVGDDFDPQSDVDPYDRSMDAHTERSSPSLPTTPALARNGSQTGSTSVSAGKKRKIVSLYDLEDDAVASASNTEAETSFGDAEPRRRRRPNGQAAVVVIADSDEEAETGGSSTRRRAPAKTKSKTSPSKKPRKSAAEPTAAKGRKARASKGRAAASTPAASATPTPLRRSTRASAQDSTARQRATERAQLDALRDVLDDAQMAEEEEDADFGEAADFEDDGGDKDDDDDVVDED